MRPLPFVLSCVLVSAATVAGPVSASGSGPAHASVTITAQFSSRTSLKVSTRVLRFDITDPAQPATAEVEVDAGVRTRSGGEIVLSVESERALDGPGGAADVDSSIVFEGEGEGLLSGSLAPSASRVAGRWVGSGKRSGRFVFALRTSAPGTYTLPVRFVLSAP